MHFSCEKIYSDVTPSALNDLNQISHMSFKQCLRYVKPGKVTSKTELNIWASLPNEKDLGPFSNILLYGHELPMKLNAHKALIKLVKRGWLKVYKVHRHPQTGTRVDNHPFTFILKKEKDSHVS